ncbi:prepronociceptin [Onychostruthus taczanowskii]|uniref:prepronociceptin n=1 Tax=Onychostruthus taczanowskii TaxID=356909 RepID=UPI001B80A9D0|nr:prepronociceptin [Onychostruthus taczanowskii]
MRAVLWDLLLLLWLCARARGDCRGDCLHCDRQLYRDSFDVLHDEPEEEEEEEEDISRRPGAGRAAKGVQKRYGGFIGVRKSARKWNNQKRFSEFLKQYLGMAPRSTFRHRLPARPRPN